MRSERNWSDVPPEERLTPERLEDFGRTDDGRGWPDAYWRATIIRRLTSPDCIRAVQHFDKWWSPCGVTPAEGEELCHVHGGATKTRLRQLAWREGRYLHSRTQRTVIHLPVRTPWVDECWRENEQDALLELMTEPSYSII